MRAASQKTGQGSLVAALDVGSSKISCLIARVEKTSQNVQDLAQNTQVLGIGYQRTKGFRGGHVFDSLALEQSIRTAVDKAERQAGIAVDQLHVSLNAGRIRSQIYGTALELGGKKVRRSHKETLMRQGWQHVANSQDAVLHALPIGYTLDGDAGLPDPLGFTGKRLFADFHMVTGDIEPVKKLLACIEDCYLSPISVIAAPYASALATIRPNEAHEGVCVIDLGAGSSSVAVFANRRFVYADSLARGGIQITSALARHFSMGSREAELLKLHMAVPDRSGQVVRDMSQAYPQASLLLTEQMMAIFLHLKKKMQESNFALDASKYIVLTGGGAGFHDAPRIAAQIFGKPARRASLQAMNGVPPQLVSPPFASLWGILSGREQYKNELSSRYGHLTGGQSRRSAARLGNWIQRLGSK